MITSPPNQKKSRLLLNAAVALPMLLAVTIHPALADNYQADAPVGTDVSWADLLWTGGSGSTPGVTDNARITRGNGNNTQIRMPGGEYSLRSLTYSGGTNQLRIMNPSSTVESKLIVTEGLDIEAGLLIFSKDGSGQRFAVETNAVTVRDGAILQIGRLNAGVGFASQSTSIESGGTLQVGWNPSGQIGFGNVINNGTFYLAGAISIAGNYEIEVGGLSGSSSSVVTTATTTLNPGVTLALGQGTTGRSLYEGTVSDGVGTVRVAKTGSGMQIFSGANTYSGGTLIEGGIVAVNNQTGSGLGSGRVEVASGGTLGGNGTIISEEGIVVASGGVIAPGAGENEGFRVLTIDGFASGTTTALLQMDEGAAFTFRFGTGDQSDRIEFLDYEAGDLILTDTAVNGIDVQEGNYTLFRFTDGNGESIAGDLWDGLVLGYGFEGFTTSFTYQNDPLVAGYGEIRLSVAAIPEPSTWALLGVCALLGGWGMLRQRAAGALCTGLAALCFMTSHGEAAEIRYHAEKTPEKSSPQWGLSTRAEGETAASVKDGSLQVSVENGAVHFYSIGYNEKGVPLGDATAWAPGAAGVLELQVKWRADDPAYEVFRVEFGDGEKRWVVPFYGNSVGIKKKEVGNDDFDTYRIILKDDTLRITSERAGLIAKDLRPFGGSRGSCILFGSFWNRENQTVGGKGEWALKSIRWTEDVTAIEEALKQ